LLVIKKEKNNTTAVIKIEGTSFLLKGVALLKVVLKMPFLSNKKMVMPTKPPMINNNIGNG